jgi:hypothetical protein
VPRRAAAGARRGAEFGAGLARVGGLEDFAAGAGAVVARGFAARAVASGAPFIERVDLLLKLISHQLGEPNAEIDRTVQIVDQKLNEKIVVGGSGSARGEAARFGVGCQI